MENSKPNISVKIDTKGNTIFVYTDHLEELSKLGTTSRASHVEPTSNGMWTADLSPVNGPTLGPFTTRAEALSAEITWLKEHIIYG